MGIVQALIMGLKKGKGCKALTIFTDSQAAILSSHRPAQQPGQYILRLIVGFLRWLHYRGVRVEIRWIPAHIGVPGNEKADVLAKEATGWRKSLADRPGPRGGNCNHLTNSPFIM